MAHDHPLDIFLVTSTLFVGIRIYTELYNMHINSALVTVHVTIHSHYYNHNTYNYA